jgi:hypothetical protein
MLRRPSGRRAYLSLGAAATLLVSGLLMTAACEGLLSISQVTFGSPSDDQVMCFEAGLCSVKAHEACCWDPFNQISPLSFACTSMCNARPILCDKGASCTAAGKAGYACCGCTENGQIISATCTRYCDPDSAFVLCDPTSSTQEDECAALDAGLSCKLYTGAPGYYACQP